MCEAEEEEVVTFAEATMLGGSCLFFGFIGGSALAYWLMYGLLREEITKQGFTDCGKDMRIVGHLEKRITTDSWEKVEK